MITFKIKDDDLVFNGQNDLVMVDGEDEEVQCINRIITTQLSEWLLDPEHGFEYGYIRGKNVDIDRAKLELTKAIMQETRVERVESLDISIDNQKRKVTISFKCVMINGNTIQEVSIIE